MLICAEDDGIHTAAGALSSIGPKVIALQADLATYEGCEQLIAAVDRPVDALLLDAGVGVGGAFTETSLERELRMIALNCNHTVHVAKGLVPGMVDRKQGHVLITGSEVSTSPSPFQAVYGATKAFVMSFGEALRFELEGSVAGGSFKSRMQTLMNELLPETLKARLAGMQTKPGSAKH